LFRGLSSGTGGNVEIGLNAAGNINPGADSTTLVPTVKYRFYQNKKKDVALFAGTNFYIPVRNRSYKFGSYSYLAAAKTIPNLRRAARQCFETEFGIINDERRVMSSEFLDFN
jgi:hypothetical protein